LSAFATRLATRSAHSASISAGSRLSGDHKRALRTVAGNPDAEGLQPWREVLQPHEDVATGNFQASEFAADLYKVASGARVQSRDYSDPVEFFSRTYLTEGLSDLISRAVWRLGGDDNALPVINLQTNFGGAKRTPRRRQAAMPARPQSVLTWVAYARQPRERNDLAGGTFETQFTFAQALTEAAKGTTGGPGQLLDQTGHNQGDRVDAVRGEQQQMGAEGQWRPAGLTSGCSKRGRRR